MKKQIFVFDPEKKDQFDKSIHPPVAWVPVDSDSGEGLLIYYSEPEAGGIFVVNGVLTDGYKIGLALRPGLRVEE